MSLLTLRGFPPTLRLLTFLSLGTFVGMVLVVARISNAASYLSDDPKACVNCHVMFPQYATWAHSSHARDVVCNECHVPHSSFLAKYMFKAKDGLRHSTVFTLRREPQVMHAVEEARNVIQENCVRCHSRVVEAVGLDVHAEGERYCVDCHREVPHGSVHSLSATPNAAVPPLIPVAPFIDDGSGQP